MAQTKQQIREALEAAGTEPRHRFGQNFMIDGNLVRLVAESGMLAAGDLAIEVGPGTGTLTEELIARAGRVVAVEIDRDLAGMLRERFAGEAKFHLIEGDALAGKHALNGELLAEIESAKSKGQSCKLVANLPYNIASPLVVELLLAGVETLTFTVQKEVADRLRSAGGGDAYGPISVVVQMLARVEVLRTLPPQAFWPAPRIDSALVRLTRADRLGEGANAFGRFVHLLFSARRKTLRKAMVQAGVDAEGVLGKTGIEGRRRPEELTPEEIYLLFENAKNF
jgi:16S rRNA (adenine1518-N6/adenine1519-N6)-dimethyltransferase